MTAALTSVGVQLVSITIAASSTSNTATITTVGTGAFIVWLGATSTDTSTIESSNARIELTNTTTVTATRNTSSSATITINAAIIDGDTTNLINSVQSGTTTIGTAATSATSSISAVTNTNTAIFYLGQSTASTGSYLRSSTNVSLSGTTVTATRGASNGATIVGWCVVEFKGAALNSSTQNFTINTAASGSSFTTTISSVTTGNTLLAYGGFVSTNTTNSARNFPRLSLAAATTVQTDYQTAPLGAGGITKGVVVEFVSGILAQTIQRGTIAIAAGTSNTATITSSTAAETLCNWLGNSTTTTTLSPATAFCRITQTNATTLTETLNTSATCTGSYEAVHFNPPAPPPPPPPPPGGATYAFIGSFM